MVARPSARSRLMESTAMGMEADTVRPARRPTYTVTRSEERRVGKECRSLCDWSSDVCSSDLDGGAAERAQQADGEHGNGDGGGHGEARPQAHVHGDEIGRASCRERV